MFKNLYRPRLIDFASNRALIGLAFLAGVIISLLYRPFAQVESGDSSIWDYIAQSILRGQIPYRDVIEIKTPLSAYLSALMIGLFRFTGISDVIAIRLLYILLVGAVAATTYFVAMVYLKNRMAGIIAVLTLLMSDHFISWMISGTEPKLCMILFGLGTLIFIAQDRPFLAGGCSMLSFLCWQPGLLFTGTAVLIFSNYLKTWRDGRALKLLAGASLPLLLVIIYFSLNGALDDLWRWTIVYNYKVYAPVTHKPDSAIHVLTIFYRVFHYEIILPILSLLGLVLFASARIIARFKSRNRILEPNNFLDALWIPPVVYLLFCFINLQAGPDLIPIFPFVGLFAGFIVNKITKQLNHKNPSQSIVFADGLAKFAIIIMITLTFWNGYYFWREKGSPLREQIESLKCLNRELGEHGTIYAHGATEILVLLNKPNANPYIFLDFGKDNFIASQITESFEGFINKLETEKPKIVIFARMRKVEHKDDLNKWAETYYNKLEIVGYDEAYIRKPNQ